jgi:hypothetical protein
MKVKTIAIIAVLAASVLSVIATTTPFAYASTESETETEQEIKQMNVGSGESTNFNCGQNLIDSAGAILTCPTVGADGITVLGTE